MAASPAETRVYLFHLPAELYQKIVSYLKKDSVKNIRVTCSTLRKITPFIIDRVFISANSLNIQVFRAIADSENFRHGVTEIIWDDARLSLGPEDAIEWSRLWCLGDPYEIATDNGCPLWFKARRQDTDEPELSAKPNPLDYDNLSVEASWDHYKGLLEDQHQILQSSGDIEAFKYGLTRFPNLKRVTVTPSTHGNIGQPMYQTPMIRAFPPRFDYPLPRDWPYAREDYQMDAFAWIPSEFDDPAETEDFNWIYQDDHEYYRSKWRGVRVVLRELAEHSHEHNVTELIVGGTEIATGLNFRLFDQPCLEYNDLVTMLKRPGFRRLDLDLFTGASEIWNWTSFRSSLIYKALSEAKDLRHITLRATKAISYGEAVQPSGDGFPDYWLFPLRSVFPINCWPRLEHFGISNILVTQKRLLSFLAALPYSTRSVELSDLKWANEDEGYHSLLDEMHTRLDWRSRPVGERPKLHIVLTPAKRINENGSYMDIGNLANAFLYDNGKNPFVGRYFIIQGGVWRSFFDPEFSRSDRWT